MSTRSARATGARSFSTWSSSPRAGHAIDLTRIDRAAWLDASRRANAGDHDAMRLSIGGALV